MAIAVSLRFVCDGCGASKTFEAGAPFCGDQIPYVEGPAGWLTTGSWFACSEACAAGALDKQRSVARRHAIERVDQQFTKIVFRPIEEKK